LSDLPTLQLQSALTDLTCDEVNDPRRYMEQKQFRVSSWIIIFRHSLSRCQFVGGKLTAI